MSGILVIGEVVGGSVTSQSLEAVAAARKLASDRGETLSGALFGADLAAAVAQFDASFSALLVLDSPQLGSYLAEPYVAAAELAIKRLNPSVVLLPHGSRTRDWVPQLAARLGAGLVLDCVGVGIKADGVAVTKPMHGGAVLGELFVRGSPAIVTLRGGAFEPALAGGGGNVEHLDMPPMPVAFSISRLLQQKQVRDRVSRMQRSSSLEAGEPEAAKTGASSKKLQQPLVLPSAVPAR